ncbi:MAG TPA: hypothetical protein VF683_10705 [Chthoniobacterales bacterium]|jgi:hypothetical protein
MKSLPLRLSLILLAGICSCGIALAQDTTAPRTAPGPAVPVTVVSPPPTAPGGLGGAVGQPVSHFDFLTLLVGYLATTLIGLFGFVILWRIFWGQIDISLLISEGNGSASLSRFQFLIFTFVISLSLLLIIIGAKDGPKFPETIPAGIYALLGISAASYVVSKGIQSGVDKPRAEDDRVSPDNENAG